VSGHAKMPPATHQVSATSLKILIQQIHTHVRVERDSGMCVARRRKGAAPHSGAEEQTAHAISANAQSACLLPLKIWCIN
jgi:hypothetical protein